MVVQDRYLYFPLSPSSPAVHVPISLSAIIINSVLIWERPLFLSFSSPPRVRCDVQLALVVGKKKLIRDLSLARKKR